MITIFSTAAAMLFWFDTPAPQNLFFVFSRKMRENFKKYDVSFPTFLSVECPCFVTKLLACDICLAFWCSFLSATAQQYYQISTQNISSLREALIGLTFAPIYWLCSLIVYHAVRRLRENF